MESQGLVQGLAKTAESVVQEPVVHKDPASITMGMTHDGVPMGMFMFYDKPFGQVDSGVLEQLKTMYDFSKANTNGSDGDVLMYLRDLDRRMGTPKIGESRLSRAYNYAKITNRINDLNKQREALTT